jgi:hypothetical protein
MLLAAAFCAGVVWAMVFMVGYEVPYPLVFMTFLAIVITWGLSLELRPPPAIQPLEGDGEPELMAADQPFAEAKRWVSRLEWVRRDPTQFQRIIRPAIGALADEKLRQRHGITRASHPARAAELFGPRLTHFLDPSKLRRALDPAELLAVVKELEEF